MSVRDSFYSPDGRSATFCSYSLCVSGIKGDSNTRSSHSSGRHKHWTASTILRGWKHRQRNTAHCNSVINTSKVFNLQCYSIKTSPTSSWKCQRTLHLKKWKYGLNERRDQHVLKKHIQIGENNSNIVLRSSAWPYMGEEHLHVLLNGDSIP
jgi:hypothetical protein